MRDAEDSSGCARKMTDTLLRDINYNVTARDMPGARFYINETCTHATHTTHTRVRVRAHTHTRARAYTQNEFRCFRQSDSYWYLEVEHRRAINQTIRRLRGRTEQVESGRIERGEIKGCEERRRARREGGRCLRAACRMHLHLKWLRLPDTPLQNHVMRDFYCFHSVSFPFAPDQRRFRYLAQTTSEILGFHLRDPTFPFSLFSSVDRGFKPSICLFANMFARTYVRGCVRARVSARYRNLQKSRLEPSRFSEIETPDLQELLDTTVARQNSDFLREDLSQPRRYFDYCRLNIFLAPYESYLRRGNLFRTFQYYMRYKYNSVPLKFRRNYSLDSRILVARTLLAEFQKFSLKVTHETFHIYVIIYNIQNQTQ